MNKTSIIMLTYNHLAFNKSAIESIREHTEPETYELIVVDNGSTDGTREWLQKQEGLRLILNDVNAGFPKGCNQGMAEASPGYDILLLNNDVEVTANWLPNLQTALYSSSDIGAVQGLGREYFQERSDFVAFSPQDFARQNNVSDESRWFYSPVLHGYCLLAKRHVVDLVGGLDERYSPGYAEDDDWSYRMLQAGYYLLKCFDVHIHHYGSASFGQEKKTDQLRYLNRQKFGEKWGFNPLAAYEPGMDLSWLAQTDALEPKILYMGHGIGTDVFRLKKRFKNAEFYGIEDNPAYADVLKNLVEPVSFPLKAGFFDVIVIGETYFSQVNAHQLLIDAKTALTPQGCLVFAFSNPLYYGALQDLLKGSWYYAANGLNKRVFPLLTPNDAESLLVEIGYVDLEAYPFYEQEVSDEDELFIQSLAHLTDYGQSDDYYAKRFAFIARNNRLPQPALKSFPLVSILIPAYNRVDYLETALNSALGQTYPALEIIICDNSTTDQVKDLAAKYEAKHSHLFYVDNRIEKNRGLTQNFDYCFGLAQGDYISYLFDDDEFYPTKISQMMARFLEDDSLSLVTSRRTFIDGKGNPIENFRHHLPIEEGKQSGWSIGRKLLFEGKNCIGEPTTVLFKKADVKELPLSVYFGRKLKFYLDVQLYLKLCLIGDVYFIDDHLSKFRWHGHQATFKYEKWISADFFQMIVASYEQGVFLENEDDLKKAIRNWLYMYPIGPYLPLYREASQQEEVEYVKGLEKDLIKYSPYFRG